MARPYDKAIADIAHYVFHFKLDQGDETIWERARMALLDALACAIETAATSLEARTLIRPLIRDTIISGAFQVPGTGFKVDPIEGAFDLGVLIRYLDHNDALGGAEWGHPSGISSYVIIVD
jgi:2-methylcitrate dehydratase